MVGAAGGGGGSVATWGCGDMFLYTEGEAGVVAVAGGGGAGGNGGRSARVGKMRIGGGTTSVEGVKKGRLSRMRDR